MKITYFFSAYLLLIAPLISAQDFNFSQYQHTPLNVNPALLSSVDEARVIANYHQNKLMQSLDMQNYQVSSVLPLNFKKHTKLLQGLGLMLTHDNTGKNGLITSSGMGLAFSQGIQISKFSILSAGFLASYYLYKNTSPGEYTTGSQWIQGSGFNSALSINEQIHFETLKLFSISAGLNWHIQKDNSPRGDFGISIYHLNKPQYSFLNYEGSTLSSKYIIYATYSLIHFREFSIAPRALFIHQQLNKISFGSLITYSLKSNTKDCDLQIGFDYRNDQTGVLSFNIEQSKYLIGLSYAVGLNSRNVYSNYKSNIEVCVMIKLNKYKKHSTRRRAS